MLRHQTTEDDRWKIFLASNELQIHNEERELKNFEGSIGESNIDLNIANNKILANIQNWDIL